MDIKSIIDNSIASVINEGSGIGSNEDADTSNDKVGDFQGYQDHPGISSAIAASLAAGMGGLTLRKKLHAENHG